MSAVRTRDKIYLLSTFFSSLILLLFPLLATLLCSAPHCFSVPPCLLSKRCLNYRQVIWIICNVAKLYYTSCGHLCRCAVSHSDSYSGSQKQPETCWAAAAARAAINYDVGPREEFEQIYRTLISTIFTADHSTKHLSAHVWVKDRNKERN